jgi:hypothetical protein
MCHCSLEVQLQSILTSPQGRPPTLEFLFCPKMTAIVMMVRFDWMPQSIFLLRTCDWAIAVLLLRLSLATSAEMGRAKGNCCKRIALCTGSSYRTVIESPALFTQHQRLYMYANTVATSLRIGSVWLGFTKCKPGGLQQQILQFSVSWACNEFWVCVDPWPLYSTTLQVVTNVVVPRLSLYMRDAW